MVDPKLFWQVTRRPASRAICTAGNRIATRIPIIVMTTSNSMRVNPRARSASAPDMVPASANAWKLISTANVILAHLDAQINRTGKGAGKGS